MAINLADNRSENERAIISLIKKHDELPKAQIAELTGLSAQSATVIIKKLEHDGLVLRHAPIKGKVGQPKVPFSLNTDGAFGLGLKVGRRSFDMTLLDLCGNVRATVKEKVAYPTVDTLMSFTSRAINMLTKNIAPAHLSRIRGLGVAMPFEIWTWAEEAGAPKEMLEQWKQFNPKLALESLVSLPVLVRNDAAAACSAEMSFGNAANFSHFLYLFVGTFVGGGVVINDALFTGRSGNAGAVGSLPFFNGDKEHQLLTQSSLYVLENTLNSKGVEGRQIYSSTEYWNIDESLIENWIYSAAQGLAYASQCAMSLLDIDGVIIDGALPKPVKTRLVEQTKIEIAKRDMRGITSPHIIEGQVGAKAQSIGSANIPLVANYY
jgi:predicted NBD/HSP70 family sugar kinase